MSKRKPYISQTIRWRRVADHGLPPPYECCIVASEEYDMALAYAWRDEADQWAEDDGSGALAFTPAYWTPMPIHPELK